MGSSEAVGLRSLICLLKSGATLAGFPDFERFLIGSLFTGKIAEVPNG